MPRRPDREAKTLQLALVPKPGQEEKIRAFKELIRRNGLEISDVLFEKVEQFLKEHNWPPGNSQTVLVAFTDNAESNESQPRVFKAQIKTLRKDSLGRDVEVEKTVEVGEEFLPWLLKGWPPADDRAKQYWLKVLRQIDHPIAREILEKGG